MTTRIWFVVECNGENCGLVIRALHSMQEAREAANRLGWVVDDPSPVYLNGTTPPEPVPDRAICPKCQHKAGE